MKRKSVLFVLVFLLMSCAAATGQKRYTVPIGDSAQRGPANAPVVVVEFFDYT